MFSAEMSGISDNITEEYENGASGEDTTNSPETVAIAVSLGISAFVAVFGNAATIIAFLYDRGLREKPSNFLILSLSCSDLCVGLIITSGTVAAMLLHTWGIGEIGCRIFVSIGDLIVPLGPLLVATICLDRYLLVSRGYPQYLAIQTRRSVRLTIGLCWALTAVLCVTENALWDSAPGKENIDFTLYCKSPNASNLQFNQFGNIVYFLIPFTFVTGCSIRFLVLLRRKLKGHRQVGPSTVSSRVRSALPMRRLPSSEFLSQMSTTECTNDPTPLTVYREDSHIDYPKSPFPAFSLSEVDSRSRLLRSRYVRPTVTVVCLVAALALCYSPYCIYFLFVISFCPSCSSPSLFTTFHLFRLYNSCLDPILYAATQRRIRAFYGKRLRHIWRRLRTCVQHQVEMFIR